MTQSPQSPDISIVLAVKNEALFIRETLASIQAQAGPSFEVIVVDDHSEDDTYAIVSGHEHADLLLLRNPGVGKVAAFNHGIAQARGAWACLFAGDDVMPAGSLAARWEAIRSREGATVGLCKIVTLCVDKKKDGVLIPRAPGRGALSGASYLLSRAARERLFPLPEDLPNEDTWLQLAVTYLPGLDIVHSDVIGCAWRIHAGNSVNLLVGYPEFNAKYTARMVAFEKFYRKYANELSSPARAEVLGLVNCEKKRVEGSLFGVMISGAPLVDKLRALSYTNRATYGIRSRLYGLLSGW